MSIKDKPIEGEHKLVVTRGRGREKRGMTANGYRVSLWGNEVLELENSDGFTTFVNILKTT